MALNRYKPLSDVLCLSLCVSDCLSYLGPACQCLCIRILRVYKAGHPYKLYRRHFRHSRNSVNLRTLLTAVRVINVWNSLPADSVDFSSFVAFERTIKIKHAD